MTPKLTVFISLWLRLVYTKLCVILLCNKWRALAALWAVQCILTDSTRGFSCKRYTARQKHLTLSSQTCHTDKQTTRGTRLAEPTRPDPTRQPPRANTTNFLVSAVSRSLLAALHQHARPLRRPSPPPVPHDRPPGHMTIIRPQTVTIYGGDSQIIRSTSSSS